MKSEELENPKYLEIKFYNLNSISFNYSIFPLSGLYNPINNTESKEYQLNSKYKNFNIESPTFINTENLLKISNKESWNLLVGESNKIALILYNNSDKDLTIRKIEIEVKLENKTTYRDKNIKFKVSKIEAEIIIPPEKIHPIFLEINIKEAGVYKIKVQCNTLSTLFDYLYYKEKQNKTIKELTNKYRINKDVVEFIELHNKDLMAYNPFEMKPKFYDYNVNTCLISIEIDNISGTSLTIYDLFLVTKDNEQKKIEMVKTLEEINKGCNKNEIDSKYITLKSEEKLMVTFRINEPDIFYDVNEFILNLSWLKLFDFNPKKFKYKFFNELNTFNNYYKMIITEKPEEDIIQNQNFKIIINLKTKHKDKKYNIKITQLPIQDDDKNDREIEIIDIKEKNIELNAKIPSNNFILICKSDILGNVNLPKLKFTLTENNEKVLEEKIYYSLLWFNCISN